MPIYMIILLSVFKPKVPNTRFWYFIKATKTTINLDGIKVGDGTSNIVVLAKIIDIILH